MLSDGTNPACIALPKSARYCNNLHPRKSYSSIVVGKYGSYNGRGIALIYRVSAGKFIMKSGAVYNPGFGLES